MSTSLNSWGHKQQNSSVVLRTARSDGANYAQFSVYLWQIGVSSSHTRQMTNKVSFRLIILKYKRTGLNVFMKPGILAEFPIQCYIWLGNIPGTQSRLDDFRSL